MPDGAGKSRNQPGTDFWSLGGPARLLDAPTGPGTTPGAPLTFRDVVAIDTGRHGLARGFFRSEMSGGSEDSFFVHKRTVL